MTNFKSLAAIFGAAVLFASGAPLHASTIIYNDLPVTIPQSSPSLGFQANHTSEFGDLIQLASGPATLTSGSILMNDHALASDWPTWGDPTSWSWPITLN